MFRDYANELGLECKYESEDGVINSLKTINLPLFTIFNLNTQSLHAKFDGLLTLIDKFKANGTPPTIFAVQETWLNPNSSLNVYRLDGYNFLSNPRPEGRGGGVGIYIKSNFKSKEIFKNFFTPHVFESICVKISYNSFKAVILNIYRTPSRESRDINLFFDLFAEILSELEDLDLPTFIVGDLNFNLFSATDASSNASKLIDLFTIHGYCNTILRATRIKNFSFSLLDIIGCKDFLNNFQKSFVLVNDLSDHYLTINAFTEKNLKPTKKPQHFEKRFLEEENINSLNEALASQDWSEVIEQQDVDLSYAKFFSIFISLYNIHCPKATIRNNRRTIPQQKFMTQHLLACNRFRNKLYRKSLNEPTLDNIQRHNRYRNEYFRAVRRRKKIYYQSEIQKAGNDSRQVWSILREVMGVTKNKNEVEYLEVDGRRIVDKTEIADSFNKFFSKLGENLTPNIPNTSKHFSDYLPPRIEDSLFIPPLDELQTFHLITNCKPKSSGDLNDVSMKLLICCAANICRPLCHIYNISFSTGKFPNLMKISKCVIIYKSGPLSSIESFRGVNMINSFSKPMERYMYQQLYNFLDERSFFNCRQFGFRKHHSTAHNVLDLVNQVTAALSEGNVCAAILIDIKKCFDLIDRDILIKKLEHYGCRGVVINWFKSYYENRSQRVFFKGGYSATIEQIIIGVLQGSCLGVLCFIIFVNDLDSASREALFNLFADDTLVFLKSNTVQSLIQKINNTLPQITDWYNSNKLIINSTKTKVVLFQSPRQVFSDDDRKLLRDFPVFVNGNNEGEFFQDKITKLDLVSSSNVEEKDRSTKHLGIQIDDKLSFKAHFSHLHKRVQRAVFSLRQMKHILDLRHLKLLFNSYVKSIINYCIFIFTAVPNITLEPIKKLIKACVRIITKSSGNAHTAPLFKQLQILPFKELMDFEVGLFMFKFKNGLTPPIFNNAWNYRHQVHGYSTRGRDNFVTDHSTRSYILDSPLNYFPRFFNSLPEQLKRLQSYPEFKRKLFNYLLNRIQ